MRPRGAVVTLAAVVVGGCALAAVVSFTRPFTLSADVVTAIPLAAMLVAQIVFAVCARHAGQIATRPALLFRRFIPWLVVCIAVVAFELIEYTEQPRQAHPTLSSLSDELSQWRIGKAALFVAWLSLGWLFLRRRPVALKGSTEP
ncbi:MAG: hypothetical protein ACLP6E_15100 [Acidimicrobiales bacterium]